jgi:hypothetical protein
MFASLQKNALPMALVLLCAAAMYMVYRDMRRMETRMAQLGALVDSLADRSRDDDDMFNMLDVVCPLPAARYDTVVEEAPVPPHAQAEEAPVHPKAPVPPVQEDEEMEAEIMAAVEEAIAAA